MRFLANENFPNPSIKLLRQSGYEVVSVFEELRGIDDESVLEKAVEENLIILTFDSDYGKLLFHYNLKPPPAVVYFRFKSYTPDESANILLKELKNPKFKLEGYFSVVEKDGIRQRRL
jgi:predicted nuclease of predicted toxin-antitoxin system